MKLTAGLLLVFAALGAGAVPVSSSEWNASEVLQERDEPINVDPLFLEDQYRGIYWGTAVQYCNVRFFSLELTARAPRYLGIELHAC